nr:hypothetical protein [uncultured Flavobacterium sp.]
MQTTTQKNSIVRENRETGNTQPTHKNIWPEKASYDNENAKHTPTPQSNTEAAELGYTVRNSYDPKQTDPGKEQITNDEDDMEDLDDDFHTDQDLQHDEIDEEDLEEENDELDNPSNVLEDDFDETENLEDLDQDDEDEDEMEDDEMEEDEMEDDDAIEEKIPDNDPRKF